MNISNLQRAKELAEEIPTLDKARKALSSDKATIRIVTEQGEIITLPHSVRHNILNILNCEYERLREEVKRL
jgi:hypothetical protein